MIKKFARNTSGRDLIVGDIHGCFSKLERALQAVRFDPGRGDRLFSVGDLVDRGPESGRVLEWLAQPWFHAVRGNHEDMAIEFAGGGLASDLYVRNGGGWNIANPAEQRARLADAFRALPLAIEIETSAGPVGVVHADCPLASWPDLVGLLSRVPQTDDEARALLSVVGDCQWSRDRIRFWQGGDVEGVRAVVVGHTPVERFTSLGNVLYTDTGAWRQNGAAPRDFTILDAETLAPLPLS